MSMQAILHAINQRFTPVPRSCHIGTKRWEDSKTTNNPNQPKPNRGVVHLGPGQRGLSQAACAPLGEGTFACLCMTWWTLRLRANGGWLTGMSVHVSVPCVVGCVDHACSRTDKGFSY